MGCCAVDTLGGVPVGSPQTWESVLATGQFTGADAATPGGNDPTISAGDSLVHNKLAAGDADTLYQDAGITRWTQRLDASEDLSWRRHDGAGVFQNTPLAILVASGNILMGGNLDLNTASPTLTVGLGTGSPTITYNKLGAGAAENLWRDVGVVRWGNRFDASEDLSWRRHDAAGVFQDVPLLLEIATGDVLMANRLGVTGADPDDAPVASDDVVIGTLSQVDTGITLLVDTTGTGRYAVTDTSGAVRGALNYVEPSSRWDFQLNGSVAYSLNVAQGFFPIADLARHIGNEANRWEFVYQGVASFEVIEIDNGDSPFTVDDDGIIRLDLTGGDITLTLPAVETGRQYVLEVTAQAGGGPNDIILDPAVGDSVDVGAVNVNRTITAPAAGDGFFLFAGTTASNNWRSHGPIAQAT